MFTLVGIPFIRCPHNPIETKNIVPKALQKKILLRLTEDLFLNGVSTYFQLRYPSKMDKAASSPSKKILASLMLLNFAKANNG
jgi:hypothetical protein